MGDQSKEMFYKMRELQKNKTSQNSKETEEDEWDMNELKSLRAQKNWSKLRQYIRDMKTEANWLVIFLDDRRDL